MAANWWEQGDMASGFDCVICGDWMGPKEGHDWFEWGGVVGPEGKAGCCARCAEEAIFDAVKAAVEHELEEQRQGTA
jgi:hypothetical protein